MTFRVSVSRAIALLAAATATVIMPSASARDVPNTTVPMRPAGAGMLAGQVRDTHGRPMAGVCVSAEPAAGPISVAGRVVVTGRDGRYLLMGLAPGAYAMQYRDCVATGRIAWPGPAALNPAARLVPSTRAFAYVTRGQLTTSAPVTLRRAGAQRTLSTMPTSPRVIPLARFKRSEAHRQRGGIGGISGRVVSLRGRPLPGICVSLFLHGAIVGLVTDRQGRYDSGEAFAPGKYKVEFTPACDPFSPPVGNWAPQWYRGKYHQATATPVVIRAGQISRGISAVMRPGAVITGTVTNDRGHGVAGVCVVATAPNGTDSEAIVTTRASGRYRIEALDPGRIRVGFFPNCGSASQYLPQWWPGKPSETGSGLIRLRLRSHRSHIDARLVLGGVVSGQIRFRTKHGPPVRGICVFVQSASQQLVFFDGRSDKNGDYAVPGLPTGRYLISFGPGCDNNGNYLFQSYPHPVTVKASHVTGHINAFLQPGAIMTGTVTDKATGAPLGGICVVIDNGFGVAETAGDGSYYINQLDPGRVTVEFANCDNRGNFAPQFYRGQVNEAAATLVLLRGGGLTARIDAAMRPGGTIAGTLTSPSGRKLTNVCADAIPVGQVLAFGSFATQIDGFFARSSRGSYAIENLPAGQFQVAFGTCDGPNVADQWFIGQRDSGSASTITVQAGQVVEGINDVLRPAGVIFGQIKGPGSQMGTFICLTATNASTGTDAFEQPLSQVGGNYAIGGLATGSYIIEFRPCQEGQNLAKQWYDDAMSPGMARPVHVLAGKAVGRVDAHLVTGGSIAGRVVSRSTGKPLANVCVSAADASEPSFFGFGSSEKSGTYRLTGLNSGTYRLTFRSCGRAHLRPFMSGPVRVTAGRTVKGPNVAMTVLRGAVLTGAISGRVIGGSPHPGPAIGACVDAVYATGSNRGQFADFGTAGIGGYYQMTGLVPGEYKIFFGDPACLTDPGGLVPQWYKAKASMSAATVVTVSAGQTTREISADLRPDGSIAGTVTGPAKQALAGICVQAIPEAKGAAPFLATSGASNGSYTIGPLLPGRYTVRFFAGCGAAGYATQWWRDAGSAGTATVITVRAGSTRHGIDATMSPAA